MDNKKKLIFSVIAGILHHITLTCINVIGTFSVYYLSYVHGYNPSVTLQYGFLMSPLLSICLSISIILGGSIDRKLGCHWTIIIGSTLALFSTTMLYFFGSSIWVGYLAIMFNGLGIGLTLLVTNKNACMYYPEKKGVITGIISSCEALGLSFFGFIGETLINPENKVVPEGSDFFEHDIAKNFFNYLLLIFIVFPCGVTLSLLLLYQFKEDKPPIPNIDNVPQIKLIEDEQEGILNNNNNANPNTNNQAVLPSPSASEKSKRDLKKAFSTWRIWRLCIFKLFASFIFYLITSTAKTIGTLEHFDTQLLKYALAINGIATCVFGPVWGYLYDRFNFLILAYVITFAACSIGFLEVISLNVEWLFDTIIIINTIFFNGFTSILNPHIFKVYTLQYALELSGIITLAGGLSNVCGSTFIFLVSLFMKDNIKKAYTIVFMVGSSLNVISFIMNCFESNEAFKFDDDDNSTTNKEEEDKRKGVEELKENNNKNNADEKKKKKEDANALIE